MELIFATTNVNKIRECREMVASLPHIDVISLHQFSSYQQPEETGITFKDNAILKAVDAAKKLKKWVIADDSGLVVPMLNGEPGIFSARYAGTERNDQSNRNKLLQEMKHFRGDARGAHLHCAIAIANPTGELIKCVEGICEGKIAVEERGRNGFGYDPLFIKNDYDKTFGELDEKVKNRISHRYKALERLFIFLESQKNLG